MYTAPLIYSTKNIIANMIPTINKIALMLDIVTNTTYPLNTGCMVKSCTNCSVSCVRRMKFNMEIVTTTKKNKYP
jgi:hypothetical protein